MRTDHKLVRLERQLKGAKTQAGIALGQATMRSGTDNTVIPPDRIDPKVRPSMVDVTTIRTEKGVDYSKNPPDVWLKIFWMGIPEEYISQYEIAIAPTETSDWQFYSVEVTNMKLGAGFKLGNTALGVIPYTIHNLQPNKQYKFMIRACNINGMWGPWTPVIENAYFETEKDNQPPPKFDITTLTLLAGPGLVIGKITQEPQEDSDHWEVAASTTNGFVPSDNDIKWKGYAHVFSFDFANNNPGGTSTVYVRVREVDTSGNIGAWSDQKTVAVGRAIGEGELADNSIVARMVGANTIIAQSANIAEGVITDAKISNLSVDKLLSGTIAAKIITLQGTANDTQIKSHDYEPGSRGWAIKGDGSAEFNGVTVRGTIYADDGIFSGSLDGATGTFSGTVSIGSGRRVEISNGDITFYNSNGSYCGQFYGSTLAYTGEAVIISEDLVKLASLIVDNGNLTTYNEYGKCGNRDYAVSGGGGWSGVGVNFKNKHGYGVPNISLTEETSCNVSDKVTNYVDQYGFIFQINASAAGDKYWFGTYRAY